MDTIFTSFLKKVQIKTGVPDLVSCKKFDSNDFLRRHYPHQVKGSKLITSSQPAFTSSPVFNYIHNITLITLKFQVNSQKSLNCYWAYCGRQELAFGNLKQTRGQFKSNLKTVFYIFFSLGILFNPKC